MEDFIKDIIEESKRTHQASMQILCVQDDYARYILRADWFEGVPVVYIAYDDVNRPLEVYKEVIDVNDTQAIKDLIAEWQEIESSFGEEC